ncbi:hypothetical protein [Lactobacillus sp.]|uniref:hypothetical protein n=1 Tax=Lactobacillus sp. TaxID=1591 RepID=UPI0019BE95F1|nr:hypothetical protein [Lactobacillus sp.]MBD5429683.1 hypothetical protein [Lactobacillus sp.]
MQHTHDKTEIKNIVDEIMQERDYRPAEEIIGRTIGIKEFAKKYCCPHGIEWVKNEIFYKFNPDWVVDIHPGVGRGFTIFEDEAAVWMKEHRNEINWRSS